MTLGATAAAGVRLIVWCAACGYQIEPDAETIGSRKYGIREIDMVVSGTKRR
jgi:hypothetical protein